MELTNIKGIGETRKKAFTDSGITSIEDLADYFPYKYYDFSKTEPYADDGNVRLIKATVSENPKIVKARANLNFVSVKMIDEIGHSFTAIWYNQTYIKTQLYIGKSVYIYGKNSKTKKNVFVVSLFRSCEKLEHLGLLPVYHTISGIGQKTLADTIILGIKKLDFISVLPEYLLHKYNLIDLKQAYLEIHNPTNFVMVERASQRIEIEKLVPILAINEYYKFSRKIVKNHSYKNSYDYLNKFQQLLPFRLTSDQISVLNEIEKDLSSKYTMNRMLQGDVGSGKTVVALFGAYLAAKNGHQSAIIVPTEILANQHFETAIKLFFKDTISICKLTSSLSNIEKQVALNRISSGDAKIVIGTHSLISENVKFADLTYVVIDEQHRFGVEQRAKISQKGNSPDILVMSATPIPRSLALVVYGNLDISTINSRPNKSNIQTNIVIKSKQNDMWNYINSKIQEGSRVYVVCSKIDEENENDDINQFSAKNIYDFLCSKFDKTDVGLIHGKLSKDTQAKVIEKFKRGIIKILVSTTIVEVGVDIPESDIMVICTPERFGLATLHQLRGRIGRNGKESFCFCLANNLNEKSYERIAFFKSHQNGFDIADFDLSTRGSGDLFGTSQHGFSSDIMNNFSIRAFQTSREILEQIKQNKEYLSKVLIKGEEIMNEKSLNNIILN